MCQQRSLPLFCPACLGPRIKAVLVVFRTLDCLFTLFQCLVEAQIRVNRFGINIPHLTTRTQLHLRPCLRLQPNELMVAPCAHGRRRVPMAPPALRRCLFAPLPDRFRLGRPTPHSDNGPRLLLHASAHWAGGECTRPKMNVRWNKLRWMAHGDDVGEDGLRGRR